MQHTHTHTYTYIHNGTITHFCAILSRAHTRTHTHIHLNTLIHFSPPSSSHNHSTFPSRESNSCVNQHQSLTPTLSISVARLLNILHYIAICGHKFQLFFIHFILFYFMLFYFIFFFCGQEFVFAYFSSFWDEKFRYYLRTYICTHTHTHIRTHFELSQKKQYT